MKKNIIWIGIAVGVIIVIVVGLGIYKFNFTNDDIHLACTEEAKLCPDGSAVGRTGPNCEFAACPGEINNDLWKTITDSKTGASFQYPEQLITEYIHTVDWPPQIQVLDEPFNCTESGSEIDRAGQTIKRMVGNRVYCVTKITEGAAGSIYTQYAYAFSKDDKTIILTFTLRAVQCGNYDDPQKTACEGERESFDLDGLVDRIAQTVKWDLSQADNSLASQLAKCLPMSDTASWEKCKQLLNQIVNFDDCVNAGFSIMKSNPPQCATPDGRNFIQETNSTWEMAVQAANNCEVKKVFQAHSRVVKLTLKNGNQLIAIEPKIDEIINIMRGVETKCGSIPIGTE